MNARKSLGFAGGLLVLMGCVAWLDIGDQPAKAGQGDNAAAETVDAAPAEGLPEQCIACLMNSFATFDRAYIPALALTKMGTQKQAERAMAQLRKTWEGVRPMLGECRDQWKEDLDQVEQAIAAAEGVLAEGKPAEAHEELEVIRDQLMELRTSHGITYDLDPLNEFHTVMEAIVKPATEMQAGAVDLEYKSRLRKLSAQAQTAWETVQNTNFDDGPFLLTESRSQQLQELIQVETQALAELRSALQSENAESILKAAKALKPPFAKVYMSFGNFPKPESR